MNRQLTCPVSQVDTSMLLAQELVHFGFINEVTTPLVIRLIDTPESTSDLWTISKVTHVLVSE